MRSQRFWLLLQVVHAIHDGRTVTPATVVLDATGGATGRDVHLLRAEGRPAVVPSPAVERIPRSATRKLISLASAAVVLLTLLGFLVSQETTSSAEDRSLVGAWPEAVQWMVLSMTLSIFNKWIFISDGAQFPYPMTLSCCHMFFTSCLLHLLRYLKPQLFPGLSNPDFQRNPRPLVKLLLLIGTLLSLSVVLSNSAAVLLSVAFVNMLKGGNPVLALLLGLALGTSSCTWQMLCPVLMIMLGAMATIHGELSLSYLGLGLLVTSILIEQFRLVIFKSLMSQSGFSLDPLSALALFSPIAFVLTGAASACHEWRQPSMQRMDALQGFALVLNSLVAVTLNIAFSRLLKVASPVTFTVFGTAKDVATAFVSLLVVGGHVTSQQLAGYSVALIGMIYYDRVKRNTAVAKTPG